MRHPEEMWKDEIEAFLTHLAVDKNVSASTQNQAFSAILFLSRKVLDKELQTLFLLSLEAFTYFIYLLIRVFKRG